MVKTIAKSATKSTTTLSGRFKVVHHGKHAGDDDGERQTGSNAAT